MDFQPTASENSPLSDTLLPKETNITDFPKMKGTDELKEDPFRFWICYFYAMSIIAINVIYISCSPITKDLKTIYGLSELIISSSALFYLVLYMPFNFPSNYILDKYGIKVGMILGTVLTLIGAWVKIFVNQSFFYVMLGSFIGALGQPFILNAPAKIAAYWFKPENRVKATTFLGVINPISLGIGFLIPGLVVADITKSTVDEYKSSIYNLFFYESLVFSILCLPGLLFFREKPPTPPSHSASMKKTGFSDSLKLFYKNKNFIYLLIFFGLSNGTLSSFSIVVNILIHPFGYTSFHTSILGGILIVFGLIGSFTASLYVAKTGFYKFTLKICCLGFANSIMMISFCVYSGIPLVAYIPVIFLGFFAFPIVPIGYEMGCEILFPVGEAFTTGLLVSSSQIEATLATILLELVITEQTKTTAVISFGIFFCLIMLALVFLSFVKEDFRRTNYENNNKTKKQSRLSGSFVSLMHSIIDENKENKTEAVENRINKKLYLEAINEGNSDRSRDDDTVDTEKTSPTHMEEKEENNL